MRAHTQTTAEELVDRDVLYIIVHIHKLCKQENPKSNQTITKLNTHLAEAKLGSYIIILQ